MSGTTVVTDKTPQPPTASQAAIAVYQEMRRLAGAYLRRERPGPTLQATALVHEPYIRLAGSGTPWVDRQHFLGIAARSMRQILVERARARGAQKRWAGLDRVTLTDMLASANERGMLPCPREGGVSGAALFPPARGGKGGRAGARSPRATPKRGGVGQRACVCRGKPP